MEYQGGCHCGAVRFRFTAPDPLPVVNCNCSICRMTAFAHVFVPHAELVFDAKGDLSEYTFNTGSAKHWFCSRCGIKSFYQPRSHPGAYSVNLRCLDNSERLSITETDFDGANWEANIDVLKAPAR